MGVPPTALARGRRRGHRRLHHARRRDAHPQVLHRHGIHCVVGTTGFDEERLDQVRDVVRGQPPGRRARRPELRDRRRADDAVRRDGRAVLRVGRDHRAAPPGQGRRPSGTATHTARLIARGPAPALPGRRRTPRRTRLAGARGAARRRHPVHSVRLRGLVAHQEVMLGGIGETLTIRHDSLDRIVASCPASCSASARSAEHPGLTVGLADYLDLGA